MLKRLARGGTALTVAATLMLTPTAAFASPVSAAPGKVANQLFRAWLAGDRTAAAKVATPAAVAKIFTYVYRAPDRFAGTVCRYVHTSVRVPGGLNGIAMVVTGSKVTKVYLSRHVVKPSAAAAHLFTAWKRADRYSALEVAGTGAVKTLFKVRYDPRGVTHHWQGCSKEPKGYSCAYSYDGGAMFMHVRGSKTRGHEVRSISYIAD
ncbi:hypothetical protein LDL08_08930 [Nonomuraea glycinis]|uniref:Uncharacterized protein n=1 Tax=Nonomuraea glycinis TaxID=2047744 RepID=A0A918A7P6_9ACTN|nr:hypothetical protein [Nonomuraea glycinis]MCA2176305.1 hypothetical protein [Nonomuraea glycinis]GGP07440.1 hypothetical protein GCM10012278_35220 [Nonomuraea glycinis]